MQRKIAFPPIADKNSKVLLLGTMPGEESLRKQQYYGHPNNQFWKILFILYNKPLASDYQERVALLLENGIALWDVLQSCEGEGSLDSNIRNERPNDFNKFYLQHPLIKHVFFTSKKAEEYYRRYVKFTPDKEYATLPSPSPANARMILNEKVDKWYYILKRILSLQ